MPVTIRVLVVDPGPRLARRLVDALPRRGPVAIAGRVDDDGPAVAALLDRSADLAVVDVDRADGRGEAIVAAIARATGIGRVLAASDRVGPDVAADVVTAGASGLLPHATGAALVDAFRRAVAGELILPADDLSSLVDRVAAPAGRDGALAHLTARERDILRTLAAGASTTEVAEAFGISPFTVQSHVKNILAKLGVHSKVEAVRLAWRHGLAVPSPSAAGPG
jgi:DNA-binding NarL/FixJ family response regulator